MRKVRKIGEKYFIVIEVLNYLLALTTRMQWGVYLLYVYLSLIHWSFSDCHPAETARNAWLTASSGAV